MGALETTEMRVAVTVADFDKALRFYQDLFGFDAVKTWNEAEGRGAILRVPAATLEIIDEKQAARIDQVEVGARVSRTVRLAFEVEDAAAARQVAGEHGAATDYQPVKAPWGLTEVRVVTPDSMQMTFFEKPK